MLLSLTPTKRNLKGMDCRFEVVDAPDGLAVEGSLVAFAQLEEADLSISDGPKVIN